MNQPKIDFKMAEIVQFSYGVKTRRSNDTGLQTYVVMKPNPKENFGMIIGYEIWYDDELRYKIIKDPMGPPMIIRADCVEKATDEQVIELERMFPNLY